MYKLMEYENDLLDLFGSLNPCIRQVSIATYGESPRGTRKKPSLMYPPTIFKDLPKKDRRQHAPAALEYFSLGGDKTGQELGKWAKRCDFTKVRELHLQRLVLPDAISSLLHSNTRFPALRTLSLGTSANNLQMDEQTAAFIRTLPPLRTLNMTLGTGRLTFGAILDAHGSSLHSVSFGSSQSGFFWDYTHVADPATVRLLAKKCTNISYLDIMLPRFAGDEQDLGIYSALGSMPRLQELMLSLAFERDNANGPARGEYIEREELQGLEQRTVPASTSIEAESAAGPTQLRDHFDRGGLVTKTLVACALDDALARQIFRHIDQSKPKDNPRSLRLESLVVRTVGGRYCIDLNHCLDWIGRPRRVQRCIRDDSRDKLETSISLSNERWTQYKAMARQLHSPLTEMIDKIWPGYVGWTEREVCGLPLMSEDGTCV
ncbi:hypothetical protein HII31_06645 [Pseudocercospora fuligena]|uniref:F-box domain-containing protein n=1 Tax=Pseudocercospora fuligena TaxID=685502 RepID=A0A8H6RHP0_9PEZI|nr:hypothetical protein HII31_06645 [Pseudocercospora fuligena]